MDRTLLNPRLMRQREHVFEKLAADAICKGAKGIWKVTKWVAPKAGRIAATVAVRGADAAASTKTAKKVVQVVGALGDAREELRRSSKITPSMIIFSLLVMVGFLFYVTRDESGNNSDSESAPASATVRSFTALKPTTIVPIAISTPGESALPEEPRLAPTVVMAGGASPMPAPPAINIATPLPAPKPFIPITPTAPKFSVRTGGRVWLHAGTTLYYENSVRGHTKSAEAFKVLQYLPEKKRLYLLSRDSNGKPITVNVPEEAVFSIE